MYKETKTTLREEVAELTAALVETTLAVNTLYTDHPYGNEWAVELMNEASKLVTLPERG